MDYKEKYEMALEGIQEILSIGEDYIKMSRLQLRLQGIFPELKESEDERIKNELISLFKDGIKGISHRYTGEDCERWVAWLEKQGEKKPVPKFKIGDTMRTLQEAKDGCTDGMPVVVSIDNEYYHCTNELIAIKDQDDYEYPPINMKQKPAWSEEDEKILSTIIKEGDLKPSERQWLKSLKDRVQPKQEWSDVDKNILSRIIDNLMFLRDTISTDPNYAVNISDTEREITWLKSLKNKVQPKQEWSEEDEDIKETIIGELELVKKSVGEINYNGYDKLIDWLKSLRPQNRWKPSDEQMDALEKVTNYSAFHDAKYCVELKRLLGQLKAL